WRRSEVGETVLVCRLLDGSAGTIPARWTDLPLRGTPERSLGVVASPAAWRLLLARAGALSEHRPRRRRACAETGGDDVGTARPRSVRGDGGAGGGVGDAAGGGSAAGDAQARAAGGAAVGGRAR